MLNFFDLLFIENESRGPIEKKCKCKRDESNGNEGAGYR